jgi:hypothetical protein
MVGCGYYDIINYFCFQSLKMLADFTINTKVKTLIK